MRSVAFGTLLLATVAVAQDAPADPIAVDDLPAVWRRRILTRSVDVGLAVTGTEREPRVTLWLAERREEPADEETSSLETVVIDADRCQTTMRALRDLVPVRRVGRSPFRVSLAFGRITCGTRTIASIDDRLCVDASSPGAAYPGDDAVVDLGLLSLVGPVVSVRRDTAEARAGGPPHSFESWRTTDVTTGLPVDPDAIFDDASLVAGIRAALAATELVADHGPTLDTLTPGTTYREAVARITARPHDRGWSDSFHPFAVVDWNEADGTAGIELVVRSPFGRAYGSGSGTSAEAYVEWIELRARPRPEWIEHFRAAARGDGHFLADGAIDAM